jgi:carboxylesterase type B
VQKNIHFFGGDGSRITAAGESAGAVSILAHVRGQIPVFQNAFIMSAANIAPDSLATAQGNYDHLMSSVGLKEAPVSLQLSALRSMSPVELLNLLGVTRHTFMIEDEGFFSDYSGQRFDQLTTLPSWLKSVVVGQTKEETVIFAHKWHSMSADEMRSQWEGIYGDPTYTLEVLAAYGVSKESSHSDMVSALVAYTSDIFFNITTNAVATEHLKLPDPANPKVYQYCFEQPDVLSTLGVWRGGAYHSLDIPFLFRHPRVAGEDAPVDFRATSDCFSAAALKLVNGQEPWEDISVAKRWMKVFADHSGIKGKDEGSTARWAKLADKPERHQKFMLGMMLLGDAIGYALTTVSPADVQRL